MTNYGAYSGGYTPTITIAAPPSGGQQATAAVSEMTLNGYGSTFTGSGYAVNDILSYTGGTAAPSGTLTFKVTSVNGSGLITGLTYHSGGFYYTTPSDPVTLTGGSGTGATVSGTVWKVYTTTYTPGAGYTSVPAVTFCTWWAPGWARRAAPRP